MSKVNVFWFRRDLRLEDNVGLNQALNAGLPVVPIFIFDGYILQGLPRSDARFSFIHQNLFSIHQKLEEYGSGLLTYTDKPENVWMQILQDFEVNAVYANRDYEPYGVERDAKIFRFLEKSRVQFLTFKDQVIYEQEDILKKDGSPYTVFTPYKSRWLEKFREVGIQQSLPFRPHFFYPSNFNFPKIESLGFEYSDIKIRPYDLSIIPSYGHSRNIPFLKTSDLSPHLRFGTVSIRDVIDAIVNSSEDYLSELIWREFFMQIMYHFPRSIAENFKSKYDHITWRNDDKEFQKWCNGETGYPLVDAGMRELNQTGYMHNRVRMVVASFLCKHLLIDWRWGEAYFAEKLLDYELSSNVGNWQWVAGTGCDAAPYFRIFNPIAQQQKFDPDFKYIIQYVPELNSPEYPHPMVDQKKAYKRAMETYRIGLANV